MKFNEIMTLARNGYKYNEIKELMEIEKQEKSIVELNEMEKSGVELNEMEKSGVELDTISSLPDSGDNTNEGGDLNTEDMLTRIAELEEQLKIAQMANIQNTSHMPNKPIDLGEMFSEYL